MPLTITLVRESFAVFVIRQKKQSRKKISNPNSNRFFGDRSKSFRPKVVEQRLPSFGSNKTRPIIDEFRQNKASYLFNKIGGWIGGRRDTEVTFVLLTLLSQVQIWSLGIFQNLTLGKGALIGGPVWANRQVLE